MVQMSRVTRKTVPEVGAGNWKGPFADGGEVERRNSELIRRSRPGWHVSKTSVTRVKYDDRYAGALPQLNSADNVDRFCDQIQSSVTAVLDSFTPVQTCTMCGLASE